MPEQRKEPTSIVITAAISRRTSFTAQGPGLPVR